MKGEGRLTSNRARIIVLEGNGDRIVWALKKITFSLGQMRVSIHGTSQEMEAIRRTSAESIELVERRIAEAQN